jgi:hypothetical protein
MLLKKGMEISAFSANSICDRERSPLKDFIFLLRICLKSVPFMFIPSKASLLQNSVSFVTNSDTNSVWRGLGAVGLYYTY